MPTESPWDLVADAYLTEVVATLEPFAAEALRRAAVPAGARVLDVAAGPGTLALLAARAGARVDAVDRSAEMIRRLRGRVAAEGVATVTACVGDGMALPFPEGLFDAAFSMFGVIFFPDRDVGLREMRRVLAPGGRAVVASWVPLARVPLLAAMFEAARGIVPPPPPGGLPLADLVGLRAAMEAAGLAQVEATELADEIVVPSAEELWASFTRTTPPVVLARSKMSVAAWTERDRAARAELRRRFGDGPQPLRRIANLAIGRVSGRRPA